MSKKNTKRVIIQKVGDQGQTTTEDFLAVEEPLEIQLSFYKDGKQRRKTISITMRTPGNDFELAVGFLYTEGIIQSKSQIQKIEYVQGRHPESYENVVLVHLTPQVNIDFKKLERHFYTTSSCGVCGKTSIEALQTTGAPELLDTQPKIQQELIHFLPEKLRNQQSIFDHTGGLHAAGLFDSTGKLIALNEDVGRHNAVDKLIGSRLLEKQLPLLNAIIVVSGRVSFELVQKSLMAGIPILIAVGAPSSLAIQLADENNMTIIGFVRDQRYNIYCGQERIT